MVVEGGRVRWLLEGAAALLLALLVAPVQRWLLALLLPLLGAAALLLPLLLAPVLLLHPPAPFLPLLLPALHHRAAAAAAACLGLHEGCWRAVGEGYLIRSFGLSKRLEEEGVARAAVIDNASM